MSHLTDMMEQMRKLRNGVGIQSLLDEAYKILGNPVMMFDTEYTLVAFTPCVTDDPFWNELTTTGTFCEATQKVFDNEGFIEEVANSARIAYLKSTILKYDRMNGKLFNKNNTYVANIILLACNKVFEESDLMVFDAICKLLSKELSRSEFYLEYEQNHQEAIIRRLINGDYDKRLDLAQVGIIYDSLESNIYVAVVDISHINSSHTSAEQIRDMLRKVKPVYKFAIHLEYIVFIISTNEETLNVSKELHELIQVFEQYNMYAGISRKFENLFELQKHYEDALDALQYVLECKCSQRVFPYNANSVRIMEQIEALDNGLGIQFFLNKGPEIFGNPLLFHDMELNLLAYTEDVEICDPIWEELITYGTSSDETINLFKTEGFVGTMESTKGGAILVSKKIKFDRISWKVYSNDNIMIGCLSIVNTDKPFTEDELVLFGAFSQKFSREVRKIEFYNNYGQVYSRTVINRLLSGKIDDYTFYSEDIGNLYDKLMENLYLVVIDTSLCDAANVNLTYLRDLFNWPGTVNRYAIYEDYIVIIVSMDGTTLNANNEFNSISKVFEQHGIFAGISSPFSNVYDLRKYYIEALDALKDGMSNYP